MTRGWLLFALLCTTGAVVGVAQARRSFDLTERSWQERINTAYRVLNETDDLLREAADKLDEPDRGWRS